MSTETHATRPYSNRSPDGPWDYVVVGSGMGGMVAAATLATIGKRVLVLEQHDVPGGFTHTFKRKRWRWDVGVHAVGEVTERAILGRILARLTRDELAWAPLGSVYDTFQFPDLAIDFPNDRDRFVETLVQAFPNERRAVEQYLATFKHISSSMGRYYLSRALPPRLARVSDLTLARDALRSLTVRTSTVLDGLSSDARFKSVLAAQWGYYGVPPARSSYAIHALVARHFVHGGYYPVGGSKRIADTLLATVAARGGWTRINADVAEIVVEAGRARGVRLRNGESIRADRVVSAANALTTVQHLLPVAEREQPWAKSIAALAPSAAHVCLYIGFKGDIRGAGAGAANRWFYETWNSSAEAWHPETDAGAPVLYCSFPSLKDPLHDPGPDVLHTGEVVTFVPREYFAKWGATDWKRRGGDYDAMKTELAGRLLAQFLSHMPGLKPFVAYTELSTPLSTEHFTRAPAGAIYGLAPTPERYLTSALRPATPVRGLYLAGSDMASVGVMGAMVGGLLAATAAEPVRAVRFLRTV